MQTVPCLMMTSIKGNSSAGPHSCPVLQVVFYKRGAWCAQNQPQMAQLDNNTGHGMLLLAALEPSLHACQPRWA
jgi:hypothetical protein